MAIENRNLSAGEILVATYRKAEHRVVVVGNDETGLAFELDGGTIHKSLSAAGSAVMGGTACNGWRFWTRESERQAKAEPTAMAEEPAPTKTRKAAAQRSRVVKVIRRMKVQLGVEQGKVKYFCSSCQKPFVVDEGAEVTACPAGHAAEQLDDLAPGGEQEEASK